MTKLPNGRFHGLQYIGQVPCSTGFRAWSTLIWHLPDNGWWKISHEAIDIKMSSSRPKLAQVLLT
jgi:hypothetical protein